MFVIILDEFDDFLHLVLPIRCIILPKDYGTGNAGSNPGWAHAGTIARKYLHASTIARIASTIAMLVLSPELQVLSPEQQGTKTDIWGTKSEGETKSAPHLGHERHSASSDA